MILPVGLAPFESVALSRADGALVLSVIDEGEAEVVSVGILAPTASGSQPLVAGPKSRLVPL